jgi:hypothetical protein
MGYTKGKLYKGGIGQGKETKFWMSLMCSLYRNEYRNFRLACATMGSGLGRSEEDCKRQINWSCNTHVHGNNTGNSLCTYLYHKLAKYHSCFSYLLCFLFYKIEEQEGGTVSTGGRRGWH